MVRLLLNEFQAAMEERRKKDGFPCEKRAGELSIATGQLMYPFIRRMADAVTEAYPKVKIQVYAITNDFFGERITVSGLLTGQDVKNQLAGRQLGERLLLPENMLRSGEDVFLDDLRTGDLEGALQVPVNIVKSSGYDFVKAVLGER